ncbi:DUF305 domain-containing protein [Nocardioides koreensis]
MRTATTTRVAALLAAAALTTGLAGCGGDSDSEPAAVTSTAANGDVYDAADVTFATDMIPHHAQAVQMVEMTRGRHLDPEVALLADEIRTAQVPEVEQMTDWLTAWDVDVPATSLDHANAEADGHHMQGMEGTEDMPGMMSADELDHLDAASGADFQRRWLEMMIEHHRGAVEMARTELADGHFPAATRLAKAIERSQQDQIERMQGLLG